jgi:hypothetical protein
MWYHVEDVYEGEVGLGSTLRYCCKRLPLQGCPRARVRHVGQVYTPARLFIDSNLRTTLGYE